MTNKTRIIGVDPGSRSTGFGIIDTDGYRHQYIASGFIEVVGEDLAERLGCIFSELSSIIENHKPDLMAVEQVFMNKNADSALKLGQARGAAICAGVHRGLKIGEYSPRAIKKSVVGSGSADKQQMQHMMRILLNLNELPQSDEADALAVAVCHAHHVFNSMEKMINSRKQA